MLGKVRCNELLAKAHGLLDEFIRSEEKKYPHSTFVADNQRVFRMDPTVPPLRPSGATTNDVNEFIHFLVHRSAEEWGLKYKLWFLGSDDAKAKNIPLNGFVSALSIKSLSIWNESTKTVTDGILWIVFDMGLMVRKLFGANPKAFFEGSKDSPLHPDHVRRQFRHFNNVHRRILLHEGAHIVEHLPNLSDRLSKGLAGEPSANPREENEAWFMANAWWAMLSGDKAENDSHKDGSVDQTWLL